MLKQARIDTNGKIIESDRRIHTTKDAAKGGPDQVQWLRTPGDTATYVIRFDYPQGSPFQAGNEDIQVPPGGPRAVNQGRNTYKYRVFKGTVETDDPDVIID